MGVEGRYVNMVLKKYSKKELKKFDEQGYMIVPCKDEGEALEVKMVLKDNKRCAQAGYIVNKENKDIYFVLTKKPSVKRGRPAKVVESEKPKRGRPKKKGA